MVRIPKNGPPTHPGEMLLEEFLKPLKMTQSELADKLGVSYPRVNELIHGERGHAPLSLLLLFSLGKHLVYSVLKIGKRSCSHDFLCRLHVAVGLDKSQQKCRCAGYPGLVLTLSHALLNLTIVLPAVKACLKRSHIKSELLGDFQ